jgi:hypothetical protein
MRRSVVRLGDLDLPNRQTAIKYFDFTALSSSTETDRHAHQFTQNIRSVAALSKWHNMPNRSLLATALRVLAPFDSPIQGSYYGMSPLTP